ncbi:FMN-binding glutamate synthase family protein [bacterium]|jgi:glutamate synthase domain-containing protein 2|nr:FMN-binding glutamate synthase family protein [bacterium]
MRRQFKLIFLFLIAFFAATAPFFPKVLWALIFFGPLMAIGLKDYFQKKHTILRNFPIIGHGRYFLEMIRPEINQYFIESNSDGVPFSREQRSVVYQRAKRELDTLPFGTQKDVYEVGYEWVNHSIAPKHLTNDDMRVRIGGPDCEKPYSASLFNISAMSYGALNKNAVEALNQGAKKGGFYHNSGEGSVTPYHLKHGGDVVWQIGTGYFGCRTMNGKFSEERFRETAVHPHIKMIEIKISQGAKPGHGGILPAAKVTREIAEIRGVPMGKDVVSPPGHSAFSTPIELLEFVAKLRKLSGGKPVGFKLCVGKRREFLAICKAMNETKITPDFITVDGGEGGTGAAPLEFSNSVGCPLREGLIFVHNCLVGFNVRNQVKVIASGKVMTGFDILAKLAMGADLCNSARGMLLALGCIQALRCNSNTCPTGITTNDRNLMAGLHIPTKAERVANFQIETIKSLKDMVGVMGLSKTTEVRPWHLMRRISHNEIRHYGEIYDFIEPGSLLGSSLPKTFERAWHEAQARSFDVAPAN